MKKLDIPNHNVEKVLDACITQVKTQARKQDYKNARQSIIDAEAEYIQYATKSSPDREFYKIKNHEYVGTLLGKEMEKLYDNNFSSPRGVCRNVYNSIRMAPKHSTCPFCDERVVGALDHYLPKTSFPSLAVTPINLVPSCSDCNYSKLKYISNSADTQLLHPYFDNIEGDKFLYASINDNSAMVDFEIRVHSNWNAQLKNRVNEHFKKLELFEFYSIKSAVELSSIAEINNDLFRSKGKDGVQDQMADTADRLRSWKLNSWKTATYEAAAASDWYCDQGFSKWQ